MRTTAGPVARARELRAAAQDLCKTAQDLRSRAAAVVARHRWVLVIHGASDGEVQGHAGRPEAPRALGDLLDPDKAQPLVSEKEWVGLVDSIATGDPHALHALYGRTHRLVFTLVMRLTNNRETAEELTLDVFNDVWRRASRYEPAAGSVVGWIMSRARSRAIDHLRLQPGTHRVDQNADSPPPETASDEEGRLLHEALTVLSPAERQAIETAYFSEPSYQEVAALLEQPSGAVKTQVNSGLKKLREALAKRVKGL